MACFDVHIIIIIIIFSNQKSELSERISHNNFAEFYYDGQPRGTVKKQLLSYFLLTYNMHQYFSTININ